jgi:hypothetical protein
MGGQHQQVGEFRALRFVPIPGKEKQPPFAGTTSGRQRDPREETEFFEKRRGAL